METPIDRHGSHCLNKLVFRLSLVKPFYPSSKVLRMALRNKFLR